MPPQPPQDGLSLFWGLILGVLAYGLLRFIVKAYTPPSKELKP